MAFRRLTGDSVHWRGDLINLAAYPLIGWKQPPGNMPKHNGQE
jgi:hypothetical protein